jgi:hypothetical protein
MGTVHDLLVAHGKQGTLSLDVRREVVEAAAGYLGDEEGGIGFLYSGWCQAALPHRRLADDEHWQVDAETLTLIVESGVKPGLNGKPIPVGVPYGSRARMILFYLQSEALRTGSPEVMLGRSMRQWLEKMNVKWGGASAKAVREQAERIARCRLTFHIQRGNKVGLLNQNIMDAAMFEPSEDGRRSMFTERARLSEGFFLHLQKHPVPLEEAAIRALANNSQALDVYAWMAYRLHSLPAPRPITWKALKGQFGIGIAAMNNFRRLFLANLQLALAVYPAAKVDVTTEGITLNPSKPPVAPRVRVL